MAMKLVWDMDTMSFLELKVTEPVIEPVIEEKQKDIRIKCISCDGIGIILSPRGPECDTCNEKSVSLLVEQVNSSARSGMALYDAALTDNAKQVIEDSKKIDSSITYNGDVFNAKTIALIELKKAVFADDSIPANEKNHAYQNLVAERYVHLKEVVFKLEQQVFEATVESKVLAEDLRTFGNELRKEIRDKIQNADNQYQPPVKAAVKPRLPKGDKISAKDTLIKSFAELRGITITEAKIRIETNNFDGPLV